MSSSPRAALTNGTKNLVAQNNRSVFSHSSAGQKSTPRCQLETPVENLLLAFSIIWWLPAFLGISWLVATGHQSLPPSSHLFLPCDCLSSLPRSLLWGHLWWYLWIVQDNLTMSKSLIISAKTRGPYKFPGVRTWYLWVAIIQPTTEKHFCARGCCISPKDFALGRGY